MAILPIPIGLVVDCGHKMSFLLATSMTNLSLLQVNFIICSLRYGLEEKGGLLVGGAPYIHSMYGLWHAEHLHLVRWHVHERSHDGMVFSSVQSLALPTFMNLKHLVAG